MPADDGRRPYDHYRIAPIEQSGEQGKADASRVIQAPGFATTLDITGSCLRSTRFSARIALDERKNETTSLRTSHATATIARASCSMRSSCQSQREAQALDADADAA